MVKRNPKNSAKPSTLAGDWSRDGTLMLRIVWQLLPFSLVKRDQTKDPKSKSWTSFLYFATSGGSFCLSLVLSLFVMCDWASSNKVRKWTRSLVTHHKFNIDTVIYGYLWSHYFYQKENSVRYCIVWLWMAVKYNIIRTAALSPTIIIKLSSSTPFNCPLLAVLLAIVHLNANTTSSHQSE